MASALINSLAQNFIETASARGVLATTAESCTGGMIASAITDIAGSSVVLDRSFVTYSNEAKKEMLGVSMGLIDNHGAVSAAVARAMATGAIANSRAQISVAVTGIAGPGGGTLNKPVGLVWFACATRAGHIHTEQRVYSGGDRNYVRLKSTETALRMLNKATLQS